MTHIAIQEQLDDRTTDWLEKVSDEQYQKGNKISSGIDKKSPNSNSENIYSS